MSIDPEARQQKDAKQEVKIPRFMLFLGLAVLLGLIVFVYYHVGDTKRFLSILSQIKPMWLVWMLVLQLGTYVCVGAGWKVVMQSAGYQPSIGALSRLSVEKLSIDQLVPTMGVSGNLIVYQSMKRLGLPHLLSLEAIIVNLLSWYIAYAICTMVALTALWFYHDITKLIVYLVSVFALILVMVPLIIIWFISHKKRRLPKWLLRFKPVANIQHVINSVSPDRIYSWKLLTYNTIFSITVFLLDSGTLWVAIRSLGIHVQFLPAFISMVMAHIAATVSLLPGGLGGFEAGSVSMLVLLGVPIEAALTSTILLRGFTLWLPMIPGLWLARRDVLFRL